MVILNQKGEDIIEFTIADYWDRGIAKVKNEDSAVIHSFITKQGPALMAAVCDGVGGLSEGETASGYLCERMSDWFYREYPYILMKTSRKRRIFASLDRVVSSVHDELCSYGNQNGKLTGTTISLIILYRRHYYLYHIGDSAIYMRKSKVFEKKTKEQRTSSGKLMQCVGVNRQPTAIENTGRYRTGTVFILCTDGYAECTGSKKLDEMFPRGKMFPVSKCQLVLKEAGEAMKEQGEKDNLTAIYIKVHR